MFKSVAAHRMALYALLPLGLLAVFAPKAHAAGPFVVTRTADDGLTGSLRGEIALAEAASGSTVTFQIPTTDPGYSAATKTWTITLNNAELQITSDLSIIGPAPTSGSVAISSLPYQTQLSSRIFNVISGTVSLSNLTMENGASLSNNSPDGIPGGGGIKNAANLSLTNCVLTKNTSDEYGGTAILNQGTSAVLTMTGCAVNNNSGTSGGGGAALDNNGGEINLTNCSVDNNQTNAEFDPGGVLNIGTATLTNCDVSGNTTYGSLDTGGGIMNRGGSNTVPASTMTLIGCTISGNFTKGNGGGFYNAGNMTVAGCTLNGNQTDDRGSGGGFANSGTLTVTDSIITENTVGFQNGGGAKNAGVLTMKNCLITANYAYHGGGIFMGDPDGVSTGTLTLINSTVTGNQAADALGISIGMHSTATLTNDIVYDNILTGFDPPQQIAGTATVSHSDVQGGYPGTGNIDADPLFVRPAVIGYPTSDPGDLHLTIGSPAIGAGTTGTGVPPADIEGYPRGSHPDMGAYQFHTGFQVQGGYTLTATQNITTGTQTVAKFVSGTPGLTFTANIAWGDGTTSAGTITPDPVQAGGYVVTGSHTYTGYGPQTITVSIADTSHTVSGTALDMATVQPAVIAVNVTTQIKVTGGGFVYNRAKRRFFQTVTLKNTSSSTIAGSLALALDTLTAGATLANATGTTLYATPANSAYLDAASGGLAPGASATIVLQITYTGTSRLSYTPRVLAGPGVR